MIAELHWSKVSFTNKVCHVLYVVITILAVQTLC